MKRNYGIDILKIIAMSMVVIIHILVHGNLLDSVTYGKTQYYIVWLIEAAVLCAVNCFALATGYVSVQKEFKYIQVIKLWFEVLFYSILMTVIISFVHPEVLNIGNILKAFLPVIREQYWYLTSYIGMIVFAPFMNLLINKADNRTLTKLVIILLMIFSVVETVSREDVFRLNNGFSPLWLAVLYIVGGWLRKVNLEQKISKRKAICGYTIMVFVTWMSKIVFEFTTLKLMGKTMGGKILFMYTSPTIVMAAIFLLLFCAQIKITGEKSVPIIKRIMASNFAVYLIHDHLLVRKYVVSKYFIISPENSIVKILLLILGFYFLIYFGSILVDQIRILIFKYLKIGELSNKIYIKLQLLLKYLIDTLTPDSKLW